MASILRSFINLLSISFVLLLSLSNGVDAIPEPELLAMVSALRSRGYNLFGNALMTSDIHYDILSGTSFTFFAPTDSALFALDMTTTASYYVQNLRFHIVPRRLSMACLRSLPSGSSIPTLLPHDRILISDVERTPGTNLVTVNGVDIYFPGLFYSRDIAVHGLSSILLLRHRHRRSPIMNVEDLDGISTGFSPDNFMLVDRCESPANETPIANSPPEDIRIAPVHGSPDCVPLYDQCLSDSVETSTVNLPEEGSLVNLEGPSSFSDFFPPMTQADLLPGDRFSVEYSSYAESPDAHPYWEVYSEPVPEQRISEFGEVPVGISGGYEKGLKTEYGIYGEAPAATEDVLAESPWPLDGETECPAIAGDKV